MAVDIENDAIYQIFYKEINRYPVLSGEEQLKLFREMEKTKNKKTIQKIKDKLVNSNLKMVVMIAFEYINLSMANNPNMKVSIMDMIQAGSIGLMKAVDKFHHDMGVLFSSYATVAIRHEIEKEIQNQRFVRIPHKHYSYLNKLNKLREEHGSDVSDDVLRKELEITPLFLKILKNDSFTNRFTDLEFDTLLDLYDDDDANFAYKLKNESNQQELKKLLKKFVNKLRPSERLYITEKFLNDQNVSDAVIAKKFNVTRQYVNITICRGIERMSRLMNEEGVDIRILRNLKD